METFVNDPMSTAAQPNQRMKSKMHIMKLKKFYPKFFIVFLPIFLLCPNKSQMSRPTKKTQYQKYNQSNEYLVEEVSKTL